LDVSDLNNGLYAIKLALENEVFVKTIVKQ